MNIIAKLLHLRPGGPPGLRISTSVRASAHEDGLALLNIERGQVFLCNRTGSKIWQALSEGRKPEEVAEEISRHYGVEAGIARQHTFAFVGELERRGLMTRSAGWAA